MAKNDKPAAAPEAEAWAEAEGAARDEGAAAGRAGAGSAGRGGERAARLAAGGRSQGEHDARAEVEAGEGRGEGDGEPVVAASRKAMIAERRKRQAAEQRAKLLEAEIQKLLNDPGPEGGSPLAGTGATTVGGGPGRPGGNPALAARLTAHQAETALAAGGRPDVLGKVGTPPPAPPGPAGLRPGESEAVALAEEKAWAERATLSESMVMALKGEAEYRAKEDAFLEACAADPRLRLALREAPNPALFAYEAGRRILAQREIGDDPAAYKARLRDELRAELRAEFLNELGMDGASAPRPQVPRSLGSVTSTGPRGASGFDGATPLATILG